MLKTIKESEIKDNTILIEIDKVPSETNRTIPDSYEEEIQCVVERELKGAAERIKKYLSKEPCNECFSNVYSYLEMLSNKILERVFSRYPKMIGSISELANKFLLEEKEKAKALIDSIIDMDINHLFTNDYEYMKSWTSHVTKGAKQSAGAEGRSIFIREVRGRIEAYFKLIVRNLRDSIPKALGYTLVRTIENNMKMKLYQMLYNDKSMVSVLNEPEGIKRQRIELNRQIKVMRDAKKLISSSLLLLFLK